MRNFTRLHVLAFLSLAVALSGCDAGEDGSNTNDGTVHDGTGTNPDETADNGIAMTSPFAGDFEVDRVITDDEAGEILCENTTECTLNEELASGQTFEASLHVEGMITITHQITDTDTSVSWNGEGMIAVDFDKDCLDDDGDWNTITTYVYEFEDGTEIILVDGLLNHWVIVTGNEFSGEDGGDSFTGHISDDGSEVFFQQWTPDGDLYREKSYNNCTE